ncbi:MAG: GGDEF domain-containing protein [bacterium]
MKISTSNKLDIFKILLIFCSMSFLGLAWLTSGQNVILELDMEGLSKIDSLSSGVQRAAKLELEGNIDNSLITYLNETAIELYSSDMGSIYFNQEPEMLEIIKSYVYNYHNFREAIIDFRITEDRDLFFIASENHYDQSIIVIELITEYIDDLSDFVNLLNNLSMFNILTIAGLLFKILYDTLIELKKSKEVSKDMFIDTSTGVYNRSKCQEVMKNFSTTDEFGDRAVLIFDLNDLKKTNDSLGHRAGDLLISSFANQLKEATQIFTFDVFIGRYGGDEFMIYFSYVEEKDVILYINEINFLVNHFNETANKPFTLSFAVGYSITNAETKDISTRELFDAADEDMYKNKIAMKEKKRQELLAQGIEIEEVPDDRLQ